MLMPLLSCLISLVNLVVHVLGTPLVMPEVFSSQQRMSYFLGSPHLTDRANLGHLEFLIFQSDCYKVGTMLCERMSGCCPIHATLCKFTSSCYANYVISYRFTLYRCRDQPRTGNQDPDQDDRTKADSVGPDNVGPDQNQGT